ncbi:MAG: hypothetical protein K2I66_00330, partial [Bacteroidales bacterium]|nr:hypothetical protein [Bacteroidales bacterium]
VWIGSLMLFSKSFAGIPENDRFNVYTLKAKKTHYQKGCNYGKTEPHFIYSVSAVFVRTDGNDPFECYPGNESFNFWVQFKANTSNPEISSGECRIPLVHSNCEFYYPNLPEAELLKFPEFRVNPDDYSLKIDIYTQTNIGTVTSGTGEGAWLYDNNSGKYSKKIPLRQMLREGVRIQFSCELLELSLEPLCKPYILTTETLYKGTPYSFSTLARYECSDNGYSVMDSSYLWEYSYEGLKEPKAASSRYRIFYLDTKIDPELPFGKNIVISLLNGEPASSRNTRTVFLYPSIPQPTKTAIQTIDENKDYLTSITLTFDRQLNTDYDETITKITLYDSVAITNSNGVSESSVIHQLSFNIKQLSSSNEYTFSLPSTKYIGEGRYYVTVEGTSKGFSNNPNKEIYKDFPEEAKTAMMKVVPITVKKNKAKIYETVFTPPTCYGDFGSVVVKIDKPAYSMLGKSETINFYWLKSSGERVKVNFQHTATESNQYLYQYDSVLPEMRDFEVEKCSSISQIIVPGVTLSTGSSPLSSSTPQASSSSSGSSSSCSSGYFSINFTQPERMVISA